MLGKYQIYTVQCTRSAIWCDYVSTIYCLNFWSTLFSSVIVIYLNRIWFQAQLVALTWGGLLSRPGWWPGPRTGQSAGSLLASSCQKQEGGCLFATDLHIDRLAFWVLNNIDFDCLWALCSVVEYCFTVLCWEVTLLERQMSLEWVTGQSLTKGEGGQGTCSPLDCLELVTGTFLQIQSVLYT